MTEGLKIFELPDENDNTAFGSNQYLKNAKAEEGMDILPRENTIGPWTICQMFWGLLAKTFFLNGRFPTDGHKKGEDVFEN